MAPRFGTDTWTLEVPEGWRAWHDEECATLIGPCDLGALQISAALKASEVLDRESRDFASEHLAAGAHAEAAEAGDYAGFEIAFSDGESFWRQWFLHRGRQALFVTYNCAVDQRGAEDDAVRQALATLRQVGQERLLDELDRFERGEVSLPRLQSAIAGHRLAVEVGQDGKTSSTMSRGRSRSLDSWWRLWTGQPPFGRTWISCEPQHDMRWKLNGMTRSRVLPNSPRDQADSHAARG